MASGDLVIDLNSELMTACMFFISRASELDLAPLKAELQLGFASLILEDLNRFTLV